MVKVRVVVNNEMIQMIEIKGHADSAPCGQDLVCAGVSCITFGSCNALNELAHNSADIQIGKTIQIRVNNRSDEKCQLILQTMVIQLQTIQEQYSKYIQIKQEVSS